MCVGGVFILGSDNMITHQLRMLGSPFINNCVVLYKCCGRFAEAKRAIGVLEGTSKLNSQRSGRQQSWPELSCAHIQLKGPATGACVVTEAVCKHTCISEVQGKLSELGSTKRMLAIAGA